MSTTPLTRRTFTAATAATTLALSTAPARAIGANDRIRLGFIGVGNRGSQLLDAFLPHSDMQVVALCDVYEPYLERANAKLDVKATTYSDFRKLIERDDLDGVVIATPDHWHALQSIAACDAGKDVYVEKPLSITIHEGRRMVEAARRNKRVAQVGTHRRSSKLYTELADRLHDLAPLGKITVSRAYRLSNMFPGGIGQAAPSEAKHNENQGSAGALCHTTFPDGMWVCHAFLLFRFHLSTAHTNYTTLIEMHR